MIGSPNKPVRTRAKTWKRWIVFIVGILSIVTGAAMLLTEFDKNASASKGVGAFLALGGIWLVSIAVRGKPAETDETLDSMKGWF